MLHVLVFLSAVLAIVFGTRSVVDRPDAWPTEEWTEVGRAEAMDEITVVVAVKRRNIDELRELLLATSTPGHPRYGDFATKDEIKQLTRPSEIAINTVKDWLKNGNDVRLISDVTTNGDYLAINTVIEEAEFLLQTQYYTYERKTETVSGEVITEKVNRVRMGTDYSVPLNVAPFVDLVTPTHRFPLRSTLKVTSDRALAPGAGAVTPSFLRELYNVDDNKGKASNNSQGIASFQYQYYSMSDLTTFWKNYDIGACTVINVPSNTPSGHGLEDELDTQYISAMGEGITMQVWYNSGQFTDALLNWATNVFNDDSRAFLYSVSYGTSESYYGPSYTDKFNEELMQLGSIGVSVLFASGDSGAGGGCNYGSFYPDYPASSPYVTAVGGVYGGTPGRSPVGEEVWSNGGGGFSNYAGRQSWQENAVASYLSNNARSLPDASSYNSSGRAYPDIAAQSVDFIIVANGRNEGVSGTSCASPTAGGIFALLNDLRKQNGMAVLGFLNPFIYQTAASNSDAFNDCSTGSNVGCRYSNTAGFPAESGWDAASGYGSPNYEVLSQVVLKTGLSTKQYV